MKGFFDAFRDDGGPTMYSYTNRTPVTGDASLITIFAVFFTIFIAFVIIFPGIRKERLATFFSVTISLFIGASILVAQYGSTWQTTSGIIASKYSAYSNDKLTAEVGGYIGLMHINITYRAILTDYSSKSTNSQIIDVDYNERFWWRETTEMKACYKEALYRGSPFPILSLAEYFTLHAEGFSWGMSYRKAGYYASIMLWWSFTSWLLMNLLLVMVPRYGAYAMTFTGLFILLTNCIYWAHLPVHPLVAHVEGSILMFQFGWNYWLVLIAGLVCLFSGTVIVIIDMIFPNKFSTILEVDYDTPYDRHVIIEKSQDTSNFRRMIPKKEDPFSERFISQLSSKLRSNKEETQGVLNRGFVPNDTAEIEDFNRGKWQYPFPQSARRLPC